MALETILDTATKIVGLLGSGGVAAIGIALWRSGAASNNRKRDIQEMKAHICDIKTDLAGVKKTINNGGLANAVQVIQATCAGRMAEVETRLEEHCKLAGHPGVPEKIASLEAKVDNLGLKED